MMTRDSLAVVCPSMGSHEDAVTSWQDTMTKPWPIRIMAETEGEEAGFLAKCDRGWRETDATIIGYLHSDLTIHEWGWDVRVLHEFQDERVAVVGFVGATRLGHDDLYKTRYDYRQLARGDVWSNLTDAESHGGRDGGSREVAVVDSCAVFVRREFLGRVGGWPLDRYPNTSHCSDLWICAMARRLGQSCRMVGVVSTHRSGGRGGAGTDWLNARGGDMAMHREAHVRLAEDFRDVLPIRIGG